MILLTFNLNWLYNSTVVELMPESEDVNSINLSLADGTPATLLNISGNS